ncbi:hypothetical protein [Nonomuraea jiangxiensis]|uniref:Dynamin family protein n=1 Tax=Nonomuraea jiangxiensis TaxID=633440 RepID=A0A1G9P664_9ACTN|nr:hypothetical protein [Nonomuraea jiangxiensis]SDL94194.1 hypothetical protein SAMN05421869_13345 [Nonomuraea jiangxiensis]
MTTRSAKIAAIHAQRENDVAAAELLEGDLGELAEALGELDRTRRELATRVDDDAFDTIAALAVPLQDLIDSVAVEQKELERVLTRLRRLTLNIGVVGRARQGKSRLLQSLTGLTGQEIPDGDGGFCTGVPSLVRHSPGNATYADVFFHTAESFLNDVIAPYYERLKLGPPPHSLARFAELLPDLPEDPQDARKAERTSAYGHLAAYHTSLPHYRDLLAEPSPRRVGAEEIRAYVAQDDLRGERRFHAFRAVRRVQITTSFPQADLAGIGTIDLPGLGDTNLGDSRLLLSALEGDVDIVLFIRRPAPEGDGIQEIDNALYDLAQSALPDIPMEKRSFFFLNRRRSVDQDNLSNARAYHAALGTSSIRTVGASIVDCSQPDEVAAAFEPVIDYLLDHISELDQLLLDARRRRVAEIYRQAELLIREASALGALAQPATVWFPAFLALFNNAYEQLSVGLDLLVEQLREERARPDTALAEAVQEVLRRARDDNGIPSPEDLRTRFALEGTRQATYAHVLDEVRAHLSRHFLGLHTALQERLYAMWANVAGVLSGPGLLAPLSAQAGKDFLLAVADRVHPSVRPEGESELKFAILILTEFDLSYRGFIQHRIRPCLDGVHGDTPTMPFPKDASRVDEKTMREMLEITYEEALDRCDAALNDLLAEPSGAVFAIVEEFRDRVLRSEGVKDEWRAFYQDIRAQVWADQFEALAEQTVHLRTWNEAVRKVSSLLPEGETT